MAEETLEQRLAKLYAKRDFVDRFNEDDVKTLIDAIRDAREHGGTASVDITPLSGGGGYTITITDSEGTEHTATVKDGGDAYEVYVSTVPQDQTPMSKAEWLASLKGDTGNNGSDGHNPCLGRFTAVPSTFAETPRAGDYYYVDTVDNTTTPPTVTETKIYKYDGTQWDRGTVVDVSNLTFNSGESVIGTSIDGTGLANPTPNALAKAEDIMQLAAKLEGVTRVAEKVALIDNSTFFDGKYIKNDKTIQDSSTPTDGVPNGIIIVNVESYDKIRFLGFAREFATTAGYGFSANAIDPTSTAVQLDTATAFRADVTQPMAVKYVVDVPAGMKWFACTVYKYGTTRTAVMTKEDFYCYKIKGSLPITTDMVDMMQLAAKLEGVTRSVEKVALIDNDTYFSGKYVSFDKKIKTGQNTHGDTPIGLIIVNVDGYDKVRFLGVERAVQTTIGYGFSTNAIDPTSTAVQLDTATAFRADAAQDRAVEYVVNVPAGMKWFACTVYTFATAETTPVMTRDDFYCYKIKGSLPITTDMVDSVPRQFSKNLVESGGVYDAIVGLMSQKEVVKLAMPEFILGKYIQSVPSPSSVNYAKEEGCDTSVSYCAVTNSVCLLPYRGVTLHVKVPVGMVAFIKFLTNPTVYDVLSPRFEGESTYKVDEKYIAFIIDLAYPGTNTTFDETREIDIDEINAMVKSGEFSVTYKKESLSVKDYLHTVVNPWDGGAASRGRGNGTGSNYKKYATFLHVSDIHGDATRWRNALDAATKIGVDAVINTGDSCHLSSVNGMGYIGSIGEDYDVPQLISVGNHDVCKTGTPTAQTKLTNTATALTNQELYEEVVEPFYEKNGYQLPESTDYNTAPTYWYRDFAEKNIRYISINEYEESRVAPSGRTLFYGSRISQKQIDWLCDVLLATPAGYGVVIGLHSAPCPIVKPSVKGITGKDDFCQTLRLEYTATSSSPAPGTVVPANYQLFGISDNPLVDLIDNFINRQHAQFSYTNNTSSGTETVTVDADFSAVNSGVEFIAWVAGHAHIDYCSYIRDSLNLQLILLVTTASALYPYYDVTSLAEISDLYRGEWHGEIQDAYNVYCIDRDRKEVRIGKGGSNLTVELKERKMLVLPYAETNN